MVRGVCDRLVEAGLDPARIEWRQERASSPSSAILTTADEFDLLVVGESEPSLRERILDVITNEAFQESSQPVLIVRSQ
jgi:nucleotide-binding universal stress UspA family protein